MLKRSVRQRTGIIDAVVIISLKQVGKRGWGSSKERTFFLFSDILIYSKKNNLREKDTGKLVIILLRFRISLYFQDFVKTTAIKPFFATVVI